MVSAHKLLLFSLPLLACQLADGAQVVVNRGFDTTVAPYATSQEINAQPDLWVLQVSFKPLRLISVELTDAATGEKKRELVWYLVYRVVNQPVENGGESDDTSPVNAFDAPPGPPILAPEFTLMTDDAGVHNVYADEILPEAQLAIQRRERQNLKNSVEAVGPIPEIPAPGDMKSNALYGVAMWRGVDPRTDYFTVFMTGFSNGYLYVRGPYSYDKIQQLAANDELRMTDQAWDGKHQWVGASEVPGLFDDSKPPTAEAKAATWFVTITPDRLDASSRPAVWRKTLMQKYWRPSDEFQPDESEIRPQGDPEWIYRPDDFAGISAFYASPAAAKPANRTQSTPKATETHAPPTPTATASDSTAQPAKIPSAEADKDMTASPQTPAPTADAAPPKQKSPSVLGDLLKNLDQSVKGSSREE